MTEQDFLRTDERLRNWARWLHLSGSAPGTCASAERMYVAPRPDAEQAARGSFAPVDLRDGLNVEHAVLQLKRGHRHFVIERYCRNTSYVSLAKLFNMQVKLVEPTERRIVSIVADRLRSIDDQEHAVRARRREMMAAALAFPIHPGV